MPSRQSSSIKPLYAVPIFLVTFLGSGLYFTLQGYEDPWYVMSPNIAVLPAIIFLFLRSPDSFDKTLDNFLEGLGNKNILTMCCIFLLSGAFGELTKAAGCATAASTFLVDYLPAFIFLPGLFLLTSFISTAIGSSMGVIATVGPLALPLAEATGLPPGLTMATVISGAMFGDNLSMISDTTIAAVNTVGAPLREKFIFNSKVASIAGLLTCITLYLLQPEITLQNNHIQSHWLMSLKILPYLLVIVLAFRGMHVLKVLTFGCAVTTVYIIVEAEHPFQVIAQHVQEGFFNLWPITLLSLCIAGMSSLIYEQGGFKAIMRIADKILNVKTYVSQRRVELLMGTLSSFYDICIANNTIAIILSGSVTKELAEKFKIPKERAATWIDTFSCIFQGIIPYGAQILLASALCKCSPIAIAPQVYYSYILLSVVLVIILKNKRRVKG